MRPVTCRCPCTNLGSFVGRTFFARAARSRQGLVVAGALVASAGLIAVVVVSTATPRRSELAAVFPPFASSFGVSRAQTQGLWSPKNELRDKARQREQYWQQQNQGIEEGLLDPMDTFAAPRRVQALRGVNNWQLDLTSPRLQAAEQAKFDSQEVARYKLGEEVKSWDPTTWHNVVGARKIRTQGLSQANEPWNLDASSGRLQNAEKKAYYKLRKERYERGETNHGKYPADEEWIMPASHGARMQGLFAQPFDDGWKVDETSGIHTRSAL